MNIPLVTSFLEKLQSRQQEQEAIALEELKARYHAFRIFLENNGTALELLAKLDSLLIRGDSDEIKKLVADLISVTTELVDGLNILSNYGHVQLYGFHGRMSEQIFAIQDTIKDEDARDFCIPLSQLPRNGERLAGKKAANIARLKRLALPVPDGFICTVYATKRFLKMGTLAADIQRILRDITQGRLELNRGANRITTKIMDAPLPDELARSLENQYQLLAKQGLGDPEASLPISVRSSGVAEDGVEYSFAGQFSSVLNVVGVPSLFVAFKEVIASGFSARAISYRLNAGLPPLDFDLAVLCQIMAPVDCAGVLFTVDAVEPENGRMLISAVPGLGTLAVGGTSPADLYRPPRSAMEGALPGMEDEFSCQIGPKTSRQADMLLDGSQINTKTMREIPLPDGGTRIEQVDPLRGNMPLLNSWVIARLMYFGMLLENLWGMPQDIEWAYSAEHGLSLLQARPLRLAAKSGRKPQHDTTDRLLQGICASSGKVVGCVRKAHSINDLIALGSEQSKLRSLPTIVVLPQSIVEASNLLPLCRGAIIDTGNPTDHLSCIARELGMPMLTDCQEALTTLTDGQWIILDADNGSVFTASEVVSSAAIKAFNDQQKNKTSPATADPLTKFRSGTIAAEREALRKLLLPLNLTDAYGSTFSILECRSIHDIIRYAHEMAVLAMFSTGDAIMDFAGSLLRQLDIGVPISFLLIDVGGGIRRSHESFLRKQLALHKPLDLNDILCIPLQALCKGLLTPNLSYHSAPDAGAMSGILSRTLLDKRGKRPAGSFNYALVARDYINLNAKVEYHFAMLDAICGRNTRANYIRFRFKGGGAGLERGHRRAIFLQKVLEENGFFTTVVGDLITASLTGASRDRVYKQLIMLGRLFGYSRFLDGVMHDEKSPEIFARAFLEGKYNTREFE
ncbi:PEP/pyruvate-binding domain-containing protein [Desulfogranum japonicum]|uniref:PEP/pyruvate-binding domain-containing protein n=1 Tax=Desulfogranum japonicum TaxID=231447 RepID=UPI00040705A3|nr:PEP/pyruvate-binding domain-containing protein [Desulfogranum japonicum]